MATKLIR